MLCDCTSVWRSANTCCVSVYLSDVSHLSLCCSEHGEVDSASPIQTDKKIIGQGPRRLCPFSHVSGSPGSRRSPFLSSRVLYVEHAEVQVFILCACIVPPFSARWLPTRPVLLRVMSQEEDSQELIDCLDMLSLTTA